MNFKRLQIYFFLGVFAVSLLLTFIIYRPYASLIIFSGVLAILTYPFYRLMLKAARGQRTVAALVTVFLTLVVVVLPFALVIVSLATDAVELFNRVRTQVSFRDVEGTLSRFVGPEQAERLAAQFTEAVTNLAAYAQPIFSNLAANIFSLFSNTVSIVFGLFLILLSMYYMLKDGVAVKEELLKLSPLPDESDVAIYDRIRDAIRAVALGAFLISISKGLLGGLLFFLLGIKAPVFWGAMVALSHFVPGLGTGLVTAPMAIYLVATGQVWQGVLLAVVAALTIGLVDNFLGPQIIKSRIHIHPMFILFSILGGLSVFGGFGVFFGPIILSVTAALVDIYKKEFREYLEKLK